jgi:hypothetical protein
MNSQKLRDAGSPAHSAGFRYTIELRGEFIARQKGLEFRTLGRYRFAPDSNWSLDAPRSSVSASS